MIVQDSGSHNEGEITAITLRFLRKYYRNRLRDGDVEISADARGKGGIVADGFLTYPVPGGGWFVATFESTSLDTRHEVRFSRRKGLLFADNMTVAMWGTAIGGALNYTQGWVSIKTYGPILPWGMFFSVFTILFFTFRMWAIPWRRYRVIQAVEQFKRYHSDEQWMAVGHDVFNGTLDPYYLELRHQCIRYGFGLLIIDHQGQVRIQLTPSREDVFAGQRKLVQFFSRQGLSRSIASLSDHTWFKNLEEGVNRVTAPLEPYLRSAFRREYLRQWAACIAAFLIITAIWYREFDVWTNRNVIPKIYAEEVIQKARAFPKEQEGYRLDTPFFEPPAFSADKVSYLDEWSAEQAEELQFLTQSPRNAVFADGAAGLDYQDCSFFQKSKSPGFVVVDAIYRDVESSMLRVEQLQEAGVLCGSVWLGCLNIQSSGFLVYFGKVFANEKEAKGHANQLRESKIAHSGKDFLTVKVLR